MRIAFALLTAAVLTAAAPAKDFRTVTSIAPTGGVVTGNPAAKIALVEYLSFTCPHCAHFAAESKPQLHDGWVRNGTVKVEVRSAVRDAFDLTAWTVTRCGGPRRFAAISSAIFATQSDWIAKGSAYAQANKDSLNALSQRDQLKAIADNSGLAAIGAKAGVTPAALNTCFATDATMKPLLAMTDAAFAKIKGTPGFEINGTLVDGVASWAGLEPALRAAGAK